MLHVWQVIRSRLASAGLTLWLAIVLYAVSHFLPVTRLLDQWLLGWEASISTAEIAAETLWRGKHEWLFVFGWLPNLWFWLGVACWLIGRRRNRRLAGIGTGLAGHAWHDTQPRSNIRVLGPLSQGAEDEANDLATQWRYDMKALQNWRDSKKHQIGIYTEHIPHPIPAFDPSLLEGM